MLCHLIRKCDSIPIGLRVSFLFKQTSNRDMMDTETSLGSNSNGVDSTVFALTLLETSSAEYTRSGLLVVVGFLSALSTPGARSCKVFNTLSQLLYYGCHLASLLVVVPRFLGLDSPKYGLCSLTSAFNDSYVQRRCVLSISILQSFQRIVASMLVLFEYTDNWTGTARIVDHNCIRINSFSKHTIKNYISF